MTPKEKDIKIVRVSVSFRHYPQMSYIIQWDKYRSQWTVGDGGRDIRLDITWCSPTKRMQLGLWNRFKLSYLTKRVITEHLRDKGVKQVGDRLNTKVKHLWED